MNHLHAIYTLSIFRLYVVDSPFGTLILENIVGGILVLTKKN